MKQELDKLLCERYPKIMVNRNKSMLETCMCWGFDCGDGWFNILDKLMDNIQHHIDWSGKQRDSANKFNEIAAQCKAGIFDLFEQDNKDTVLTYKEEKLARIVAGEFRTVPDVVCQVTLDQVKEKFGTLRVYYAGGDDVIDGMVRMAESMSAVTCEECSAPAETHGPGWIRTICKLCEEKREAERAEYAKKNGLEE